MVQQAYISNMKYWVYILFKAELQDSTSFFFFFRSSPQPQLKHYCNHVILLFCNPWFLVPDVMLKKKKSLLPLREVDFLHCHTSHSWGYKELYVPWCNAKRVCSDAHQSEAQIGRLRLRDLSITLTQSYNGEVTRKVAVGIESTAAWGFKKQKLQRMKPVIQITHIHFLLNYKRGKQMEYRSAQSTKTSATRKNIFVRSSALRKSRL